MRERFTYLLAKSPARQKGFMTIVLIVFLVVFVAIAAAIVSMSTSGARSSADHAQASQALFMAESGIEWAAGFLLGAEADNESETRCNDLVDETDPPLSVNGDRFYIRQSEYSDPEEGGDGSCSLTSVGMVGETRRVLTGKIPASVLEGETGGGDDLFNDDTAWRPDANVQDGVLTLSSDDGDAFANRGKEVLTDDFKAGDTVYFAANIDPGGAGLEVRVTFPGNPNDYAICNGMQPCASAVDPNHELFDSYNTVWVLDSSISGDRDEVNQVQFEVVDFSQYSVDSVKIENACIGRAPHCAAAGGDDPTEEGSWDENP